MFSKVYFFVSSHLLAFVFICCLLIIYWKVGNAQLRTLFALRPRTWTPKGNRVSFQCGRKHFSALSDLRSTQLPIQWTRVFFTWGQCSQGVKLSSNMYTVPRLGMSETRHLNFDIAFYRVAEIRTVTILPLRLIRIASVVFNCSHLINQTGLITFVNITYLFCSGNMFVIFLT